MDVADSYMGHCEDPSVIDQLADTDPIRVRLSDTERRRSRVRTQTESGGDLGIVLSRELENGDVLETDSGDLVVITLEAIDALVVDFGPADIPATDALELGHALGNRHRKLSVRDSEAIVPVADSRQRTKDTVQPYLPPGATVGFRKVAPTLFTDDQNHRGVTHDHATDEPASHSHGHGESHVHSHTHADGKSGQEHSHDVTDSSLSGSESNTEDGRAQ